MTDVRGFTLVEALVALVVLSIGMLGIAALYVESLKAGRSAIYRTQAVNLAADMADRIRVNPATEPTVAGAYTGAGANNNCAGGADCTPADMAAHDVFLWRQVIQGLLPDGQGAIAYDAGPIPDQYTITISWSEVGEVVPATYQLVVQI
jgi:type IV pilus assembly protein PilV